MFLEGLNKVMCSLILMNERQCIKSELPICKSEELERYCHATYSIILHLKFWTEYIHL